MKDVGSLATRAFHQAKLVGLDKNELLRIPPAADKDGWNALWQRLGRPEKADGYKFTAVDPKTLPTGMKVDEKLQAAFTGWAHEVGLTQSQADALYQRYNAAQIETHKGLLATLETNKANGVKALREDPEFGGQAFEQNIDLAFKAMAHYGDDKLAEELVRTQQGNNPALIKIFAKLGKGLAEDGIIGKGGEGGAAGAMSPAEARQQINAKLADQGFMKSYMDKRAPDHNDRVAEMQRLHEFLVEKTEAA